MRQEYIPQLLRIAQRIDGDDAVVVRRNADQLGRMCQRRKRRDKIVVKAQILQLRRIGQRIMFST